MIVDANATAGIATRIRAVSSERSRAGARRAGGRRSRDAI